MIYFDTEMSALTFRYDQVEISCRLERQEHSLDTKKNLLSIGETYK